MSLSELSARLEHSLVSRDIESGLGLIQEHCDLLSELSNRSDDAGVLLGCMAKWIDMDFSLLDPIDQLLKDRFQKYCRTSLPFQDVAYLRFADGAVAMHRGRLEDALHELSAALCDANDIGDTDLRISASYFAARSLRMLGHYGDAEHYVTMAESLSSAAAEPREKQLAVIKTLRAWLLFQKGDRALAQELLEWAKSKLETSSDYVSKGNAWSMQARMERRLGLAHMNSFNRAIEEYEKGGEAGRKHPNLARVLANKALGNIIQAHRNALTMEEKLAQPSLDRQKKADQVTDLKRIIDELHRKADADLTRAEQICVPLQMRRVLATCCLRRAFMYLEQSNTDQAKEKVKQAYKLASEHGDTIAMGRAKVLECKIEDQDYLAGLGPDPMQHGQLAYECASEAVKLAEHTENRGLRCRAHLAMGFAVLNLQNDRQSATAHLKNAETLYNSGGLDFLREDIQSLQAKIVNRSTISAELSAWIQRPEGKSLDELVNLLYGLVWKHVGHKIGRVANNLDVLHETAKEHLVQAGFLKDKKKPAA